MKHFRLVSFLGSLLLLAGCLDPDSPECRMDPERPECIAGGFARAFGKITDEGGWQRRDFGGEGTVMSSTSVQAYAIGDGGALELLAEAEVAADGSYSMELPSGQEQILVQAIDASGEVRAAAVLEASGAPDGEVPVTPMDSESSLEAAVFAEMAASSSDVSYIDLRARIDASMAIALQIAEVRGEDTSDEISALAQASLAAQRTEIEAYASSGMSVTERDLFRAELEASQELSARLNDGDTESYESFFAAMQASMEAMGADAEAQARAEGCAGMSFRAIVDARMASEESAAVREASLLAAASLEARAQAAAIEAILIAGEAGADTQAQGEAAAAELRAAISSAANAQAAASAYASFSADIRGEGSAGGSLPAGYLGADLLTEAMVQSSATASASAAATLESSLSAIFDGAIGASGAIDFSALASAIVDAYGTYFASTSAATGSLAVAFGDLEAATAASLLIAADGSFSSGS